jgi:hypothetical protein
MKILGLYVIEQEVSYGDYLDLSGVVIGGGENFMVSCCIYFAPFYVSCGNTGHCVTDLSGSE